MKINTDLLKIMVVFMIVMVGAVCTQKLHAVTYTEDFSSYDMDTINGEAGPNNELWYLYAGDETDFNVSNTGAPGSGYLSGQYLQMDQNEGAFLLNMLNASSDVDGTTMQFDMVISGFHSDDGSDLYINLYGSAPDYGHFAGLFFAWNMVEYDIGYLTSESDFISLGIAVADGEQFELTLSIDFSSKELQVEKNTDGWTSSFDFRDTSVTEFSNYSFILESDAVESTGQVWVDNIIIDNLTPLPPLSSVPEPSTFMLVFLGIIAGFLRKFKQNK